MCEYIFFTPDEIQYDISVGRDLISILVNVFNFKTIYIYNYGGVPYRICR